MAAKRACHAPSDALALDHVRVGVIHCLGSLLDAVAFLRAMPSLDGPLVALLELLTTSSTVMKQWPVIVFDLVGAEDMDLALAALPALPTIHVSLCETLQGALAGRYDSLSAFTAAWPTKIMHLNQCVNRDDATAVSSWTLHCTHLDFMHFDVAAFATVLPFLPPSLRHVMFVDSNDDGDILVESNLAPSLQQWLGNGRLKKHINFLCKLAKDDAAAVADVLASALSVTTLEMTSSHELVKALIASTKPLSHVTRFGIRRVPTNDAKLLVARLSLHHLTRLKVEASVKDLTWVLHLLPSMPHLQELLLGFGMLHEAPDTLGASRLRKLALNHVQLSDKAFSALLKWTSGLQQLQAAVFRGISLNGKWFSLQQMMRHHWLVTAGSCALIQDGQALVSPPSLQGLAIHPDTVEALVRALSRVVHTTVVRLATDINTETYNEAARRAWMDFGVAMLPREYNEYDLVAHIVAKTMR